VPNWKTYVVYMSYTRTLFDPFRPPSLNESTSTVLIDMSVQRVCRMSCVCIYICTEINSRFVSWRDVACMLSWRRIGDVHRSHADSPPCPPMCHVSASVNYKTGIEIGVILASSNFVAVRCAKIIDVYIPRSREMREATRIELVDRSQLTLSIPDHRGNIRVRNIHVCTCTHV